MPSSVARTNSGLSEMRLRIHMPTRLRGIASRNGMRQPHESSAGPSNTQLVSAATPAPASVPTKQLLEAYEV